MKKILIIGDSNGLGEWGQVTPGPGVANNNNNTIFRPYNQDKYLEGKHPKPFQLVYPGFGYFLDLKGYATCNHSFGGAGNFEAIFKAEEALGLAPPFTSPTFYTPDLIIWMLTEPCRNYTLESKYICQNSGQAGLWDLDKHYYKLYQPNIVDKVPTIAELNRVLMKTAFDGAQEIYDVLKIPFILIEGWGETYGLENDYTFIKHIHKGWLQKILGRQIPLLTSWNSINNIKQSRHELADSEEFKTEIRKYEEVVDYMRQSDDFPDNGHPGRELHKKLAEELEPYV